jgi:hypothetical protein
MIGQMAIVDLTESLICDKRRFTTTRVNDFDGN